MVTIPPQQYSQHKEYLYVTQMFQATKNIRKKTSFLLFSLELLRVYKNYLHNETKLEIDCSLRNIGCSGIYHCLESFFMVD